MKGFLKKYVLLILASLLAFGVFSGMVTANSQHSRTLTDQSLEIQKLKGDLAAKEDAAAKARDANSKLATGVDTTRKATDDQKATAVLSAAMTWNSYESYNQARNKVMSLGIPATSDLLTKVLPMVENRTDPSGKSYNVIDTQGLNMSFVSMESRVSVIKATDYSYFAVVTVRTASKVGQGTADTYYAASYTTNANGSIIAITLDSIPYSPSQEG